MHLPQFSDLHLWSMQLEEKMYQNEFLSYLNADEVQRAERFHFKIHRQRFIIARAVLRSIIGLYLNINPKNVQLMYGFKGKPYLSDTELQFNLSHSHDMAVYAFVYRMSVGIDIEKIQNHYNDNVAKRFFSEKEYLVFSALPEEQKLTVFYKMWTEKESIMKGLGEGFHLASSSFTVPANVISKKVILKNIPNEIWHLENRDVFSGYQCSFATSEKISRVSYWTWTDQEGKKWRDDDILTIS